MPSCNRRDSLTGFPNRQAFYGDCSALFPQIASKLPVSEKEVGTPRSGEDAPMRPGTMSSMRFP